MTDSSPDPRTPGRRRTLRSTLAQADLVRRLRALALPEESLARVVRLLEREIDAALVARSEDQFTSAEIEAAGGDADLIEALRTRRRDEARAEAIRKAGLADLDAEQLQAVLAAAGGK